MTTFFYYKNSNFCICIENARIRMALWIFHCTIICFHLIYLCLGFVLWVCICRSITFWNLKSFTKVQDHASSPNFLISFRKREYLETVARLNQITQKTSENQTISRPRGTTHPDISYEMRLRLERETQYENSLE